MDTDLNPSPPAPPAHTYPFEFNGSAREYFKIWIVNLLLTVITAGIYAAWAKVRTRRYLYASTVLAGHEFDYLADPVKILKGHLIVAGLFICYMVTGEFRPEWAWVMVGLFYLIFPFLAYKSLRFHTRNSAYRNICFAFRGSLGQSYLIFLFAPLLIPLTLGIYFPRWAFLKKKYLFDHLGFGSSDNRFQGRSGLFYKTYGIALIQFILIGLVPALGAGAVILSAGSGSADHFFDDPQAFGALMGVMVFCYLGMILAATIPFQYIYARVANHCWNSSRLGGMRIKSRLKAGKLAGIQLTNILAIIFSLGLLTPWAKIRRTRYILSCMALEDQGNLASIAAGGETEVSALGDAAVDFFDFDIGW